MTPGRTLATGRQVATARPARAAAEPATVPRSPDGRRRYTRPCVLRDPSAPAPPADRPPAAQRAIVGGLVSGALAIGAAGYHWLDGLSWLDATLNAAMILTGMGPVNPLVNPAAKVFAIVYSLASGVFFLTMVAVLLAPGVHHLLHRFHLELDEQRRRRDG